MQRFKIEFLMAMSRRAKILAATGLLLVSVLVLAYANRTNLIISLVGFVNKVANPVGPHQPISWQQGGVWEGKGQRPPNLAYRYLSSALSG